MLNDEPKTVDEIMGLVDSAIQGFNRNSDVTRLREAITAVAAERDQAVRFWKEIIADFSTDAECLPACDSYSHAEFCPVVNSWEAFKQLKRENEALKAKLHAATITAAHSELVITGENTASYAMEPDEKDAEINALKARVVELEKAINNSWWWFNEDYEVGCRHCPVQIEMPEDWDYEEPDEFTHAPACIVKSIEAKHE